MKKNIIISALLSLGVLALAGTVLAGAIPVDGLPTDVDQCKKDGWRNYYVDEAASIGMFKNQGDCVSFVVTDGRNEPDGPPIH